MPIIQLIIILAVIGLLLWLLQVFGIFDMGSNLRIGGHHRGIN